MKHTCSAQWLLAAALVMMSLDASAIMTIKPKPAEPGHEQHQRRGGKIFNLTGFENSRVTLIKPDLTRSEITSNAPVISFKPTGMDNYHVLVASRENNDVNETAIRYVYSFGKPSGFSPKQLTETNKSTLEIVPDPIPREHWHYKAGYEAAFIVRYKQQPLANADISLSTSHASIVNATTDTQGRVVFNIPDDYKVSTPGREANPPAELLVHVKYDDKGQKHATWLSADYEANPAQWKSTSLGTMVATGGFLFGAFITGLGFRSKKTNRQ